MKIKGRVIQGCNVEILVIPRSGGEDIVFKAKSIVDMDPFEKICPEPQPPIIRTKTGTQPDFKSTVYAQAIVEHSNKRNAWMIVTSLTATEGLVWDTVDLLDPNTWTNYRTELKASGFSQIEINRIVQLAYDANCLNEAKLEEARNRFLASELKQFAESSSQKDEPQNMQPGELVNALT